MKSTQQIVIGILYLALFSMIACKKDNPTPAPDPRDKFMDVVFSGYYSTTGICTDTSSRINNGNSVNNIACHFTKSDNNSITLSSMYFYTFTGIVVDSTINWYVYYYKNTNGNTSVLNFGGGKFTLHDSVIIGYVPTLEVITSNGLNFSCEGYQTWYLKKE